MSDQRQTIARTNQPFKKATSIFKVNVEDLPTVVEIRECCSAVAFDLIAPRAKEHHGIKILTCVNSHNAFKPRSMHYEANIARCFFINALQGDFVSIEVSHDLEFQRHYQSLPIVARTFRVVEENIDRVTA